ncbi:MAG: HTH domain-containing protein, partial [Hungatella sp.]|nr:HTH domain-containing protein [Hungatella sp.]
MEEITRKLVKTLIDSYPDVLTGKELAMLLKVSEKSIQKYIHNLNKEAGLDIITSSNKGYKADYTASVRFLSQMIIPPSIPQTSEQRYRWIAKKLLIDKADEVDAFQLCEDLFISYQTLKNVIKKFNSAYENYKIQIKFRKNKLVVVGDEYDKRKAISGMIYDEGSHSYINYKVLEEQFEKELVWEVK